MKLLNNYLKEMKIAIVGFYFYVEIVSAIVMLILIMFFVPEEINILSKEIVYFENEIYKDLIIADESIREIESENIRLNKQEFEYFDENNKPYKLKFNDDKQLVVQKYIAKDKRTDKDFKEIYIAKSFEDMIRISNKLKIPAYKLNANNSINIFLTGNETQKYKNLLKLTLSNDNNVKINNEIDKINTRYLGERTVLNNKTRLLPIIILALNGVMEIMIIIAYIISDRSQGIIKSMSVAPISLLSYLMSKILVVLTMAIISSLIIVIPILKLDANYPLLIIAIFSITIVSSSVGLYMASFYKDIKSSFSSLLIIMIILQIPAISEYLPSFMPFWLKFIPSYHMLGIIKESLISSGNSSVVIINSAIMLVMSAIILFFSEKRYKKIIGI